MMSPLRAPRLAMPIRLTLAIASLLFLGLVVYYGTSSGYQAWKRRAVESLKPSELLTHAVEAREKNTEQLYELALIMLGVIAALVFAKKDEVRITAADTLEICMAAATLLLLLISCALHYCYTELIIGYYYSGAALPEPVDVPDIFNPKAEVFFCVQYSALVAGAITAIFTLFSVHWLKDTFTIPMKESA